MKQLDCDYVRDSYPEVLNGEADAARVQQVRAHIASCEACRAEAAIVDALHAQTIEAPVGLHARIRAAAVSPSPRAGIPTARIVMAASVAIALIGGSALLRSHEETVVSASTGFGFVSVEAAMLSGKASLSDWSEEELELLLEEMES
jgi:predicted anti-sigma-YlaC factor YlaD